MSYPRIASELYCSPWNLMGHVHASICEQFRAHVDGGHDLTTPAQAADDTVGPVSEWTGKPVLPQVEVRGELAIVPPVKGIIGKGLNQLEMTCGGYDLRVLEEQVANIRDDERIKAAVFSFDTPGGKAQGNKEGTLSIRSLREAGKLTVGYTDTLCASAGYFLMSECDVVVASPTAIVGSISTILAAVDDTRKWEMDGLKLKLFTDGDFKAVGHPGKEWTPDEEAYLRERVAYWGGQFKDHVRERRGLADEHMQGQWWAAEVAPDGVVDQIEHDFEKVLAGVLAMIR